MNLFKGESFLTHFIDFVLAKDRHGVMSCDIRCTSYTAILIQTTTPLLQAFTDSLTNSTETCMYPDSEYPPPPPPHTS